MMKLAECDEEETDMFLFMASLVGPATKPSSFCCHSKGDMRAQVRDQYLMNLERHPTRLRILSDEWDNVHTCAMKMGYKEEWLSPGLLSAWMNARARQQDITASPLAFTGTGRHHRALQDISASPTPSPEAARERDRDRRRPAIQDAAPAFAPVERRPLEKQPPVPPPRRRVRSPSVLSRDSAASSTQRPPAPVSPVRKPAPDPSPVPQLAPMSWSMPALRPRKAAAAPVREIDPFQNKAKETHVAKRRKRDVEGIEDDARGSGDKSDVGTASDDDLIEQAPMLFSNIFRIKHNRQNRRRRRRPGETRARRAPTSLPRARATATPRTATPKQLRAAPQHPEGPAVRTPRTRRSLRRRTSRSLRSDCRASGSVSTRENMINNKTNIQAVRIATDAAALLKLPFAENHRRCAAARLRRRTAGRAEAPGHVATRGQPRSVCTRVVVRFKNMGAKSVLRPLKRPLSAVASNAPGPY